MGSYAIMDATCNFARDTVNTPMHDSSTSNKETEGLGARIDDGAAGLHVGHRLLRQADHAHDVDQERLLQARPVDVRKVLHRISLQQQRCVKGA